MAARWEWSIGPWKAGASANPILQSLGGPQGTIPSAKARSLHVALDDPSTASFTISGLSNEALWVEELITDLWVYRNGVALYRGRVMSTTDTIGTTYDLKVDTRDYRSVLDRRIAEVARTWSSIEQSTIVWDALTDTRNQSGGDLGLVKGTWPTTGVVRSSATIALGTSVWAFIKLTGGQSNGFDFDIDANLAANLYYPQRGADNGVILDYGGAVKEATRTVTSEKYSNAWLQSGAEGVATYTATTSDIATTPEGRWETAAGDTELATATTVQATAESSLGGASRIVPSYDLKLAAGVWGGPTHIWVGDYVTAAIRRGRLNEVATMRVMTMDIELDASDQETVTITVGTPRLSPLSVLRGIAKRVAVLSR